MVDSGAKTQKSTTLEFKSSTLELVTSINN